MKEAVIVSAVRTAAGKARKGGFSQTRAEDLGKAVLEEAVRRTPGLSKAEVEDVILGCAFPEGQQGANVARIISLYAGFPVTTPALTVTRLCASGLQAVAFAAERIMAGHADVIVAGGVESMTHVPMWGFRYSPHPVLVTEYPEIYLGMGLTAERVAEKYGITREDQDRYAAASHRKAAEAIWAGRFQEEIVPVTAELKRVDDRGNVTVVKKVIDSDEGVRMDTSVESLSKLKPVFKRNGTVTVGNASQMSDGAAALVVMSARKAESLGLKPLASFRSYAVAGVEPEIMGIGPVPAIPKALRMAGLSKQDVKLFEINEAFAAQTLASIRELDLDETRVNVNGGAIALGHPLGCTGAKLTATLIHELRRRGGGYGVVSMCIGGGMGAAGVFEVFA